MKGYFFQQTPCHGPSIDECCKPPILPHFGGAKTEREKAELQPARHSENRAYHQLGNAVCPPVVQAIAQNLLEALGLIPETGEKEEEEKKAAWLLSESGQIHTWLAPPSLFAWIFELLLFFGNRGFSSGPTRR